MRSRWRLAKTAERCAKLWSSKGAATHFGPKKCRPTPRATLPISLAAPPTPCVVPPGNLCRATTAMVTSPDSMRGSADPMDSADPPPHGQLRRPHAQLRPAHGQPRRPADLGGNGACICEKPRLEDLVGGTAPRFDDLVVAPPIRRHDGQLRRHDLWCCRPHGRHHRPHERPHQDPRRPDRRLRPPPLFANNPLDAPKRPLVIPFLVFGPKPPVVNRR